VQIAGETITINPTAVSARVHGLLDNLARLDEVLPDRFVYTLMCRPPTPPLKPAAP
jgi:hypothetical protein